MLRLTNEPKALQVVSRMYVSFWVSNGTDPVFKLEDQKEIIEQQYGTVLMENTANQKILLRWCESWSPINIKPFLEQEITVLQDEYAWTMSTTDSRTIINKIKNDLLITNGLIDNIKVLSFNKAGNIQDSLIFYIHAKLDLYGNGSVIINKTFRPSVRVTLCEQDIVRLGNRLRFN